MVNKHIVRLVYGAGALFVIALGVSLVMGLAYAVASNLLVGLTIIGIGLAYGLGIIVAKII